MADFFQFTNNATTTLASSAAPSDTSLTLATGTGALFPTLGAGEIFTLTLNDAATGLIEEICYCTARSGDVLTVMRAQEGTTALSWAVGALASLFPTAATYASFVQAPYVQLQPGNFAEDTGSANAAIITLDPAITSWTQLYGAPIRILKMGSPNAAGAYTINANGIGPVNVVLATGANPAAGNLPAHCIFEVIASPYSGDLQLMSVLAAGGGGGGPPTGPAGGDLTGTYPNPTIAANKVTNAKLAQMAALTFKSNLTNATANAADNPIDDILAYLGNLSGGTAIALPSAGAAAGTVGSSGSFPITAGLIVNWAYVQFEDFNADTATSFPYATDFATRPLLSWNANFCAAQGLSTEQAGRGVLSVDALGTSSASFILRNTDTTGTKCAFLIVIIGY